MTWTVARALAAAIAAAAGCGAEEAAAPASSAGPLAEYRPCAADRTIGAFTVIVQPDFTSIEGRVEDAVDPGRIPQLVKQAGDCRILKQRSLFCDPACGSEQTCGAGGKCVPHPARKSVGKVTVTGLKTPLTMSPSGPSKSYGNEDSLPHPAFDEGADLRLEAAGGDLPRFSLRGFGIVALRPGAMEFLLERGKALRLAWAPPGKAGPQRVHIELALNHHGGTPSWLECDVADSGSFEIPAALVTELRDLEVSGYPTVILNRRSVDSATVGPGCVELAVASEVELDVKIPGVTSCKAGFEECPAGQKCDLGRQICK